MSSREGPIEDHLRNMFMTSGIRVIATVPILTRADNMCQRLKEPPFIKAAPRCKFPLCFGGKPFPSPLRVGHSVIPRNLDHWVILSPKPFQWAQSCVWRSMAQRFDRVDSLL
jgi:hypothetical protein